MLTLLLYPGNVVASTATDRATSLRVGASSLWSSVTKTASAFSARVVGTSTADQSAPPDTVCPRPRPQLVGASSQSGGGGEGVEGGGVGDPYAGLPPLDDGGIFDSALPTDDWGLPLPLFSRVGI